MARLSYASKQAGRLTRARTDLKKAKARLERVKQWQPSEYTSQFQLEEIVIKAEARVSLLEWRVEHREKMATLVGTSV